MLSAPGSSDSNSGNSSDSNSGGSTNSSAGSGNSSDQSANASAGSANASQQSADSINGSAQSSEQSSNQSTQDSSAQSTRISVPILSTVALGGTAVGLGYLIWVATTKGAAAAATPAAAQAFLRSQSCQLEQDLALGAGPGIEDLAAVAEISREHLPRFGLLLRAHRAQLLPLLNPAELSPERAAEALAQVGALAKADPVLATDYRAFLEHHSADEG